MEKLPIQLDFRSKEPLYLQLKDQIQLLIEQNILKSDEPLPAVRSMAEILQINFNTVARAYRALDKAGWITTQRGRGTFILEPEQRNPPEENVAIEPQKEFDISQLADDFCQQAAKSGMTENQIDQMIDQQLRKARFLFPLNKLQPKRITKKKINRTSISEERNPQNQNKHRPWPNNRKRR